MQKRNAVRYSSTLLRDSMSTATVQLNRDSPMESMLVNFSAQGAGIKIPPSPSPCPVPKKDDTILIKMLLSERWLTGVCIYALAEEDGAVAIGIYFPNQYEQNHIQHLIYEALKVQPKVD